MDERTLNDLLECSVCLERLDTSSKVLPCQHTFCRKCLEIIVSSHSELRCPECRVLIEIKIDELPPNVLLMRILEGMKNASHNQINSAISLNRPVTSPAAPQSMAQPQQPQNTGNQTNSAKTITNRALDDQNIISSRQQTHQHNHQQQLQLQPHSQQFSTKQFSSNSISIPHARALYDFQSTENGDISFKKGDHILLRKRIDLYWFVGEVHGKEGVFPVNHVKIIVALPVPQCKALYDFRMGPNEEEGCLTFKKGTLINVYRRVDHNWAEGRIGECIGIFPIAFVEMNALAKQIMDSASNLQYTISSRAVPPPPITEQTSSNDSSSTVTTSPNSSTSSNTSSNSSSAPSSPITNAIVTTTPPAPPPKISQQARKRHSLTTLTTNVATPTSSLHQMNRHSVEILSVPDTIDALQPLATSSSPGNNHSHDTITPSSTTPTLKSSGPSFVPNLPATYVALYPYKPQKSDELELKKGSVYYVSERCQDGWFKGSNRGQKSGVFPGNYVAPLRNNRENNQILNLKRQGHTQHHQQHSASAATQQQHHHHHHHQQHSTHNSHGAPAIPPPELPPRSITTNGGSSVWSKPLGQHVESFFSRKSTGNSNTKDTPTTAGHPAPTSASKDRKETSSAVSLMKRLTNIKRSKSPTPTSAYSMDNPVFEDTVISPSCSSSGSTSTTTPATASTKRNVHMSHPVHVRSGSCPSQLLQSLPLDLNATVNGDYTFGSQRGKGHKDRPTLHGIRTNFDGNRSGRGTITVPTTADIIAHNHSPAIAKHGPHPHPYTASASYHRKSQSLDAATISAQIANHATKINKSHPHHHHHQQHHTSTTATTTTTTTTTTNMHKERFRCIVSYPPNSEFELELHVGDIVFVHKKRDNGWYKGTHSQTGKIGLFPASFVEPDI